MGGLNISPPHPLLSLLNIDSTYPDTLKWNLKKIRKKIGDTNMRFSISTIIGDVLGAATFVSYTSLVRPVDWFDSLIGMILAVIVFVVVKKFKGLK